MPGLDLRAEDDGKFVAVPRAYGRVDGFVECCEKLFGELNVFKTWSC